MIRVGVSLSQVHPSRMEELAVTADGLGFESLWLGEHLVFPMDMRGELVRGEKHNVKPTTPVFDVCAYLSWLAAKTSDVRLGTFVYLLGLRHPFVAARAFATLDIVSGGRAEAGLGAGWLETEWAAAGLDFSTRGRRLDEAIDVCRALWSEPVVEHHGEFFDFDPVAFEPKPVQARIPVHIGGESPAALRRAARVAQGWLGLRHTPESARSQIARLRRFEDEAGRSAAPVQTTVIGDVTVDQPLQAWEEAGVDRLIVAPWTRSRDAVRGLEKLAREIY
ncbi:MAG TPA: TIGR03619 family F420-dependent LLM class oxidoreductase [Amycolatopsis sp.]|nr:TIGR03619 family F420-dependent LLM class oxidoreductase [Amycolatopsis sp.]